jgi:hypothetical protein
VAPGEAQPAAVREAAVRAALGAALRVHHDGPCDVWLLDEGDDPGMRALCGELGVRHFSPHGLAEPHRSRDGCPAGAPHGSPAGAPHGTQDGWLRAHGGGYDVLVCVDTDRVPPPDFCERVLGCFRDPDVALVVGPQVLGDDGAAVTGAAQGRRWLPFRAPALREGRRRSPVPVGTPAAVRIAALRQLGGHHDSVTADMATALESPRGRNPVTGNRWKSVHTPEMAAAGEGPASWTDFFNQELRWSRLTYETLLRQFCRRAWGLSPGRLLTPALMACFYPAAALTWLLGGVSSVLYLGFGSSHVRVPAETWIMLYSDAAALQVLLYTWHRRHHASPHEPQGSSGAAGMLMSALCGPIYAAALLQTLLRRRSPLAAAPGPGGPTGGDRLRTHRVHLFWAAVFGGSLAASFVTGNTHTAMRGWAGVALCFSLLPLLIQRYERTRTRRRHPVG